MQDNATRKRNTGLAVAAARLVLALAFWGVLIAEPSLPFRSFGYGYGAPVLTAYLGWALMLLAVARYSWWYDHRLAPVAQVVDMLVLLASVYLTETPVSEFQTPFLAFAAFLLISSMVRWNWRVTAITAAVLLVINLVVGLTLYRFGYQIDLLRFGRRVIYIVLLASMLLWLSTARGTGRAVSLPESPGVPGERRDSVIDPALATAASALGAWRVALALASSEEPWIELRIFGPNGIDVQRLMPDGVAEELLDPGPPALLSTRRQRQLRLSGEGGLCFARSGPVSSLLLDRLGIDEGLVAPVRSVMGSGQLVAWAIDGPCRDDIALLAAIGQELGLALDREETARLSRVSAADAVRQALARDLHDSLAQFLAGTLFRLEALRRWISEGNDPEPEIAAIKNALRQEQSQLRQLIDRLRRGEDGERETDLVAEISDLLVQTGAHWHIRTRLDAPDHPLLLPLHIAHEVRQLVREGVANAARHGQCSAVEIGLASRDGTLHLTISDDGGGFTSVDGVAPRPRSIAERVAALGGSFELHDTAQGACLVIALPTGEQA